MDLVTQFALSYHLICHLLFHICSNLWSYSVLKVCSSIIRNKKKNTQWLVAPLLSYSKTFRNSFKGLEKRGRKGRCIHMLFSTVFSVQTHFYFCISFTSFSECLDRESSNILTLAPNMPSH